MNRKDIQKSVWDRAFDDLDEEGNPIEKPRAIKSDQAVNVARSNRLMTQTPEWKKANERGLAKRKELYNLSELAKETAKKRYNFPGGEQRKLEVLNNAKKTMSTHPNLIASRKKRSLETSREISTPFGIFPSYNEANKSIPVDIGKKMITMPHLYYYTDEGPGDIVYENVYNTPYGQSNKRSDVYNFSKENNEYWSMRISHKAHWWTQVSKNMPSDYFISNNPAIEWSTIGILRNINKRKKINSQ